jgi:hypothetical protein
LRSLDCAKFARNRFARRDRFQEVSTSRFLHRKT